MFRNSSLMIRQVAARFVQQSSPTITICRASSTVTNAKPEQPLPLPGEEKIFPAKLHDIVNSISKLSLIEVAELNQLLKKTLNIPDAPIMTAAVGATVGVQASAAAAADEEAEPEVVKSAYVVKLIKYDETKKVALIKEIKSIVEGMNLVQAKKFVESVPQVIKADLSKDDAEKLKTQLESLGGQVVVS